MMNNTDSPRLIWEALHRAAVAEPSRIGYVFRGREFSYQQMDELSDRVACGLLNLGYCAGERLGIIALTIPEWIITYFAAAKIGVIIVGLNIRYRDSELEYMINQSQARGIVSTNKQDDMDYVTFFDGFREKIPSVKDFVFFEGEGFEGSTSFDSLLHSEINSPALDQAKSEVQPDDLVIIIYTSGTTGKPKGAALSNKSQLASALAQVKHTESTADDISVLAMPLNHVGGITCGVVASLLRRAKIVLLPAFSPAEVIEQSRLHGATGIGGVPTMHTLMLMNAAFPTWDTSNVRTVTTGGSNADPALLNQLKQAYPNATIMNLYGLSEVSGGMVMSPKDCDFETLVRSIGKVMEGFEAKVIDMEGAEVPRGEKGELCLKGDAMAKGYFRMEKETEEAFGADGWLRTGDIAYIDEDEYITLVGRKKEMYLQGGFNVYPAEVENLLSKHPDVMMVAGIGVPDPVLGEVGRYYIILKPGSTPDAEDIISYCKKHLADYKIPRQIVFREELPMTPVGKIMKSKLKDEYAATELDSTN